MPSFSRPLSYNGGGGNLRRRAQSLTKSSKSESDISSGAPFEGAKVRVFCDIVLESVEDLSNGSWAIPDEYTQFLQAISEPVFERTPTLVDAKCSRPRTAPAPVQHVKVDMNKVKNSIRELAITERSYLNKITRLKEDFADPLREFARRPSTAIVSTFEAETLFCNIDDLVRIAGGFEHILGKMHATLMKQDKLPTNFGSLILTHVRKMEPFKIWLDNVYTCEEMYKNLVKVNTAFVNFVERTQVHSSETAQTTAGFKEFLAEPFQRVSRYNLMIEPIIKNLPPDDGNIPALQEASQHLSTICSMNVDRETIDAAVIWSLSETIEGLPRNVLHNARFVACIDADEVLDDAKETHLRSTLILLDTALIFAKRPTLDRTGRSLLGLDDLETLVKLHRAAGLTSAQSAMIGSPKKLKRGVFSCKAVSPATGVYAMDLSPREFGLLLDYAPESSSERWSGRTRRRYRLAAAATPVERAAFVSHVCEHQAFAREVKGLALARRSTVGDADIFWSVVEKRDWLAMTCRNRLALHLTLDPDTRDLSLLQDGNAPLTVARATFLRNKNTLADGYDEGDGSSGLCFFAVRSEEPQHIAGVETIAPRDIPSRLVDLTRAHSLWGFENFAQPARLRAPGGDLPTPIRKRSFISAAVDVFNGSSALKRGHSDNSSQGHLRPHSSHGSGSTGLSPVHGSGPILSPSPSRTPSSAHSHSHSSNEEHAHTMSGPSFSHSRTFSGSATLSTVGSIYSSMKSKATVTRQNYMNGARPIDGDYVDVEELRGDLPSELQATAISSSNPAPVHSRQVSSASTLQRVAPASMSTQSSPTRAQPQSPIHQHPQSPVRQHPSSSMRQHPPSLSKRLPPAPSEDATQDATQDAPSPGPVSALRRSSPAYVLDDSNTLGFFAHEPKTPSRVKSQDSPQVATLNLGEVPATPSHSGPGTRMHLRGSQTPTPTRGSHTPTSARSPNGVVGTTRGSKSPIPFPAYVSPEPAFSPHTAQLGTPTTRFPRGGEAAKTAAEDSGARAVERYPSTISLLDSVPPHLANVEPPPKRITASPRLQQFQTPAYVISTPLRETPDALPPLPVHELAVSTSGARRMRGPRAPIAPRVSVPRNYGALEDAPETVDDLIGSIDLALNGTGGSDGDDYASYDNPSESNSMRDVSNSLPKRKGESVDRRTPSKKRTPRVPVVEQLRAHLEELKRFTDTTADKENRVSKENQALARRKPSQESLGYSMSSISRSPHVHNLKSFVGPPSRSTTPGLADAQLQQWIEKQALLLDLLEQE